MSELATTITKDPSKRYKELMRAAQGGSLQPAQNRGLSPERLYDQFVYDTTLALAADWLDATNGAPITVQQYRSLFNNGHISYTEDEVLRIFDDWEDYQQLAESYRVEQQQARDEKIASLLTIFDTMREEGLMPDEFFDEVIVRKYEYCEVHPKDGQRGKVKKIQRYDFTGERASQEYILSRCSKYLVASEVLKNRASEKEVPQQRVVDIALGFYAKTSTPVSSFNGAIHNSNTKLGENAVQDVAEQLGVEEYLFVGARSMYLNELLANSEELFYNTKLMRILGTEATKEYLRGRPLTENVYPLSRLLFTDMLDGVDIAPEQQANGSSDTEACLKTGKLLVRLALRETRQPEVDDNVLRRAKMLGLNTNS